jgi:integrase
MGLYRQGKSPVWWMSFTTNGRQYRESTGTENRNLASRILDKIKGQIAEGKWFPEAKEKPKHTFDELAEKYSLWCDGRQRAWSKAKKYLVKQLADRYTGWMLNDFDMNTVEQMQTDIIAKGRRDATVNKKVFVLKHMFAKAVDWEMVDESVLRKIRKVKPLKNVGKRLRYLSREECRELVNACDSHLRPIVVTALNTGMRRGEIFSLKWDNVDLKHGFILLDRTKNGERREIPISATLRELFNSLPRRLDVSFVFYDPITGKPYQDIKRSFKSALKRAEIQKCPDCNYQKPRLKTKDAEKCPNCNIKMEVLKGISDFRFHDLRHTFASHLVMAGVDITSVKELLGHKDIKMTLRYAHLAPAHKVRAMEIYDNILNENGPITGCVKRENGTNYHNFIIPRQERRVEGL